MEKIENAINFVVKEVNIDLTQE